MVRAARDNPAAPGAGRDRPADRARPVLRDLATNLTHAGPLGAGQTAKIISQAMVGTGYLLMAEILALAATNGMDVAQLPACLAGAIGGATPDEAQGRVWPYLAALVGAVTLVAAIPLLSIGFL